MGSKHNVETKVPIILNENYANSFSYSCNRCKLLLLTHKVCNLAKESQLR